MKRLKKPVVLAAALLAGSLLTAAAEAGEREGGIGHGADRVAHHITGGKWDRKDPGRGQVRHRKGGHAHHRRHLGAPHGLHPHGAGHHGSHPYRSHRRHLPHRPYWHRYRHHGYRHHGYRHHGYRYRSHRYYGSGISFELDGLHYHLGGVH